MLDDRDRNYLLKSPTCAPCRHRIGHRRLTCAAFAEHIPLQIWNGEHDHRAPVDGDHGIRFTEMTPADREQVERLAEETAERVRDRTDRLRRERGLPAIDWTRHRRTQGGPGEGPS